MPLAPMKIGMYYFRRMLTSKSTPVVVTVAPDRITVAAADQLLLDAAAQQVAVKRSKVSGALTLTSPTGDVIIAGIGSHSGAEFSPQQEAEIVAAQQAAAADPQTAQLELAQTLWVGRPTVADGSYRGALRSFPDAKSQRRIGPIVADAMIAAGARAV